MKRKLMFAIVILIVLSMPFSITSRVTVFAESTVSTSKASFRELSWTEGNQFPVVNGHTIYPTLPLSVPPLNFPTRWYAGTVYPASLSTQNARSICASIDVPNSAPLVDELYYVLLSTWDSNGSYNQIGFSNTFGTWGLSYSWTTGPQSNLTFHSDSNVTALSMGVTYAFNIATQNNVTQFAAYQGSTLVWSLDAPTGGNYLILNNTYGTKGDYTVYEEVWRTHTSGGAPRFNFYFHDQYWVATNGSSYFPTWTNIPGSEGNPVPDGTSVLIDGGDVYIWNPGVVPLQYPVSISVGSVNPIPPHYSVFQVYHHGVRLNGQNISMSYTVTVSRTDNDTSVGLLDVEVGLKRTNVNNASDYLTIGTAEVVLATSGNCDYTFVWNETNTMNPGTYIITGFANSFTNNTFDMNPADNQLTNDTVEAKELMGDTSGNGIVDIYDAIQLANAFTSTPTSPKWNPDCDLNKDGHVDIYDAIIFAAHFGSSIGGGSGQGSQMGGSAMGAKTMLDAGAGIAVDPSQLTVFRDEMLNVNVKVTSVTDLLGWEFKLFWNSTVLNCTNAVVQTPTEWQGSAQNYGPGLENDYNATHARFWAAQSANYPAPSFNGSMNIATLTFRALRSGTTSLTLVDTKLGNSTAQPIDHVDSSGSVSVYYGRYMRSDAKSVNGLNAYLLNATRTTSSLYQSANTTGQSPVTWGIRAWVRHSNGTEQEITLDGQTGTPKAQVSRSSGYGIQSNTVSATQRSMQTTDSLVVRVYMNMGGGGWTQTATFTTEQLGATTLTGTTWTVYYYSSATYNRITDKTYGRYYWGSSAYDSRIQNLQYA